MKAKIGHSSQWLVFLLLVLVSSAQAGKDGYKIELTLNGVRDSVCYLANYYGDKTYLADTAYAKSPGQYVFTGDSLLPGGIYIIAGQSNNKLLEVILDKEQRFSLKATVPDIPGTIKFKHSKENTLFYDFIQTNIVLRKKIEQLNKKISKKDEATDSVDVYKSMVQALEKKLDNFKDSLAEENPEIFISTLIRAMKEPGLVSIQNKNNDSIDQYQLYKSHYWDNFNIADDRLLRTPLYHTRLENYFNKVVYQHSDSIIREADRIIEMARPNPETFKYLVWFLTYKFETTKIMGFDEIFVHLVDNYYAKGEAYWADSSVVKSLKKRARELHNVLIGNHANNLVLIDTSGSFRSLYHLDAPYTLVFFYESDCSHCRKEIKALKEWHGENELDFEIFAVCTDTSLAAWKSFIVEHELNWINVNGTRSITQDYHHLYDIRTTPTLFLLDADKKILAKRLKTEQMRPFLENYHRTSESEGRD